MTTLDIPSDTSAALVYAEWPPDLPNEQFVDVRPGGSAWFDGSRFHAPIHVTGPTDRRRTFDNNEIAAITSAAKAHLREPDGAFLRLGNRVRFRDIWSAETVAAIERRLVATARREGATLVTWTDGGHRSTDAVDYDVVVSR